MARKKEEMYAIGVILGENKIKFVTLLGDHHTARWENGKPAMLFSKEYAKDICYGFACNGICGVPILKEEYVILTNSEE